MKARSLIIVVTAIAVLLVGCGSSQDDGSALQGTRWVLVTLGGESLLPGRAPSVEFAEDQISGSAGCNTYFSTYEVSGDELSIGDIAVTEMWCMEPEGLMDQETAFLAALNTVASYQVDAGRLELYNEAGTQVLVFGPEESALVATLEAQEPLSTGGTVNTRFTLTNTSSEGLFVLKWFTPLEGLAGDIFQIERDGAELPYVGKLVKRGAPTSDDYVWIDAGGSISAEVDLAEGYDFSQAGEYTVQFRSPRLSHTARTSGEQADSLDELEVVPIQSDPVSVTVGG